MASTLMPGDSVGLSDLFLRVTQVTPFPMVFRLTSASPTAFKKKKRNGKEKKEEKRIAMHTDERIVLVIPRPHITHNQVHKSRLPHVPAHQSGEFDQ